MKLDQDYKEDYDDINSPRSRVLITVLDSKLKPFFKKKFPDFIVINIISVFSKEVLALTMNYYFQQPQL